MHRILTSNIVRYQRDGCCCCCCFWAQHLIIICSTRKLCSVIYIVCVSKDLCSIMENQFWFDWVWLVFVCVCVCVDSLTNGQGALYTYSDARITSVYFVRYTHYNLDCTYFCYVMASTKCKIEFTKFNLFLVLIFCVCVCVFVVAVSFGSVLPSNFSVPFVVGSVYHSLSPF